MGGMEGRFVSLQIIHAVASSWLLSTIYASPLLESHRILLDYLKQFASSVSLPWMLMLGDFNDVRYSSEKFSVVVLS